jgi:hypothetical protein
VQTVRLVAVSLVPAGVAVSARAQVDNPTEDLPRDRFVIDLGGFAVTSLVNGSLRGSANTSDQDSEVFGISYQGINGNWSDLRAGATWMFSHHFGLGVGYDRLATHVDVSKGSFNGRLNFGYQGLLMYLKGGF